MSELFTKSTGKVPYWFYERFLHCRCTVMHELPVNNNPPRWRVVQVLVWMDCPNCVGTGMYACPANEIAIKSGYYADNID